MPSIIARTTGMCFSTPKFPDPPKVPKPPAPPNKAASANKAERLRKQLAARRGYGSTIRTSPQGATGFLATQQQAAPALTGAP